MILLSSLLVIIIGSFSANQAFSAHYEQNIVIMQTDTNKFTVECLAPSDSERFDFRIGYTSLDSVSKLHDDPKFFDRLLFVTSNVAQNVATGLMMKDGSDIMISCSYSNSEVVRSMSLEFISVFLKNDRDNDGILDDENGNGIIDDNDDQCPDQAENYNDYLDSDGCPDIEPTLRLVINRVNETTFSAVCTSNGEMTAFSLQAGYTNFDESLPAIPTYIEDPFFTSSDRNNNSISSMEMKDDETDIAVLCTSRDLQDDPITVIKYVSLYVERESPMDDDDNDGLTNDEELQYGTDPQNPDSDNDGLYDGEEINTYGTDPLDWDTDDGGVSDGDEIHRDDTNPLDGTDDRKWKKGKDSCADCTPPTLGIDANLKRIIDDGFSYNGNSIPVEFWFTPFPLITTTVGNTNTVEIKIFENSGVNNMKMVQFGLGATHLGQPINDVEVLIEVYLQGDGTTHGIVVDDVIIRDKDNLIDNDTVTANAYAVECIDDYVEDICTKVDLEYSYREATINNMMLVSVSDVSRNVQNFYFNHGVQVIGDSMNPAPTHKMHNKQTQQQTEDIWLTLTRTDKVNHIWEDKYEIEYLQLSEYRFDRITPPEPYVCDDKPLDEINVPTRSNCHFRALTSIWN